MDNKFARTIARILSTLFSPLMMPTYAVMMAFFFSYMYFAPVESKVSVGIVTFAITCMLPVTAIYLLYRFKIISDPALNNRRDRLFPYILTALCYLGVAFYFTRVHAPAWMSMFMCGGTAALVVTIVINNWWKISGHATGMGGLTALAFFLVYRGYNLWIDLSLPGTVLIIAGAVCTSRLILERHTLAQVSAGMANGFIWIMLSQLIAPTV